MLDEEQDFDSYHKQILQNYSFKRLQNIDFNNMKENNKLSQSQNKGLDGGIRIRIQKNKYKVGYDKNVSGSGASALNFSRSS